jgi:hypothetical protein
MRVTPPGMTAVWLSGDYMGDNRPIARATIQIPNVGYYVPHEQTFTSLLFGGGQYPVELPNIKSVSWNRSVDSDVADCIIELYNTAPLEIGQTPTREFDQLGSYTYNYGTSLNSVAWGHTANDWQGYLVPDRVIRTYEGYGCTPTVAPENDPKMMQSGTWLIDSVEYTHDGLITVKCRDFARLLLDQIIFPPVCPYARYPLYFEHYTQIANLPTIMQGNNRVGLQFNNSSNEPWVGSDGGVYGHYPHDAFDDDPGSYWLSVGNYRGDARFAYEWVQGSCGSTTVTSVTFSVVGGGYQAFLSIIANGDWVPGPIIDYHQDDIGRQKNARVPYLQTMGCPNDGNYTFNCNVPNATMVRVTLYNLPGLGPGPYIYRAAMRSLQVFASYNYTVDNGFHTTGNYSDYTDIVKVICAWGGFYWPLEGGGVMRSDNTIETTTPYEGDPALSWVTPDVQYAERIFGGDATETYNAGQADQQRYLQPGVGRAWGNFEETGTYGIATIPVPQFDKKPLMDCISYVRDIVGFIFYIDEEGGVVWRPPNIWSVGNYLSDSNGGASYIDLGDGTLTRYDRSKRQSRPNFMTLLDENQVLVGLKVSLDSKNVRETIFVATTDGKLGAATKGFNPYPIGLRRIAGWTDQFFATSAECQRMADLVVLRQLFLYRTDTVEIPGYPGIQVDDQVRLSEAVTEEGYIHYVKGISSVLDMEAGNFIYSLQTHWLGDSPDSNWAFDRYVLSPDTQAYLDAVYHGLGI